MQAIFPFIKFGVYLKNGIMGIWNFWNDETCMMTCDRIGDDSLEFNAYDHRPFLARLTQPPWSMNRISVGQFEGYIRIHEIMATLSNFEVFHLYFHLYFFIYSIFSIF
jgi:hypothetical protein